MATECNAHVAYTVKGGGGGVTGVGVGGKPVVLHAMKMCGGVEIRMHVFLTWTLVGDELPILISGRSITGLNGSQTPGEH